MNKTIDLSTKIYVFLLDYKKTPNAFDVFKLSLSSL